MFPSSLSSPFLGVWAALKLPQRRLHISTTHLCTMNIESGFVSKLMAMSQILLQAPPLEIRFSMSTEKTVSLNKECYSQTHVFLLRVYMQHVAIGVTLHWSAESRLNTYSVWSELQ